MSAAQGRYVAHATPAARPVAHTQRRPPGQRPASARPAPATRRTGAQRAGGARARKNQTGTPASPPEITNIAIIPLSRHPPSISYGLSPEPREPRGLDPAPIYRLPVPSRSGGFPWPRGYISIRGRSVSTFRFLLYWCPPCVYKSYLCPYRYALLDTASSVWYTGGMETVNDVRSNAC